ncbi:unnamed protein product, partial [Nippostrongylus brasiliensis]|uniref:PEPCK_N domain-containing protein n=1 Tax=Nippostrongylus brasiliensis TaxID=27835 RepID=A0A0N4XW59_NIPBR
IERVLLWDSYQPQRTFRRRGCQKATHSHPTSGILPTSVASVGLLPRVLEKSTERSTTKEELKTYHSLSKGDPSPFVVAQGRIEFDSYLRYVCLDADELRTYPNRPLGRSVVTAVPYACKTDFVIDGYGCVPVINGDPKWLPMKVRAFLAFHVELMRPVAIHICSGSFSEAEHLTRSLELTGVLEKLIALDNVYAARTDPADAVERATYICCKNAEEVEAKKQSKPSPAFAQWITQDQFNREVYARFPGSMQGRVMYVIPFSMGPIGGRYSINAVQLTDSPYVVLNMRLLTRWAFSLRAFCYSVMNFVGF